MLTLDLARLDVRPGQRLLDLACGDGRHARATRMCPGIALVALDLGDAEVQRTAESLREMDRPDPPFVGAVEDAGPWLVARGDTFRLPFASDSFDCVIAAEVLEHLIDDDAALREIRRVLRPAGALGVSVPRFGPELLCWALSRRYRTTPGGHVRIYRRRRLRQKLRAHGFEAYDHHFAHALHSPFWWLKCAVGLDRQDGLVGRYHRLLVWDLMEKPRLTRVIEACLNPFIGKSEVFYARKAGLPGDKVAMATPGVNRG